VNHTKIEECETQVVELLDKFSEREEYHAQRYDALSRDHQVAVAELEHLRTKVAMMEKKQ